MISFQAQFVHRSEEESRCICGFTNVNEERTEWTVVVRRPDDYLLPDEENDRRRALHVNE